MIVNPGYIYLANSQISFSQFAAVIPVGDWITLDVKRRIWWSNGWHADTVFTNDVSNDEIELVSVATIYKSVNPDFPQSPTFSLLSHAIGDIHLYDRFGA